VKGFWVARGASNVSVVFVHGILSDGESCWTNQNGCYWPELLTKEPDFNSIGIYVFTYKTGFFSGTFRLSDVVNALSAHAELDGVLESEQIIFVCHSMGGIVVRKYLVERAVDFIEAQKRIGLFLIASPSMGSSYADLLSPLARFIGNSQADILRFIRGNEWLADLDKEFKNLLGKGRLPIQGKELIEDKFIILPKVMRRQVVEEFSGAIWFPEPYKVPGSNHISIAKPENAAAIQHRLLVAFIRSFINNAPEKGEKSLPVEEKELLPAAVFLQKYLEMLDNTWVEVVRPPVSRYVIGAIDSCQGETPLFKGILNHLLAGYFSDEALSIQYAFFNKYQAPDPKYPNLYEWEQQIELDDPVLNVNTFIPKLVDEIRADTWPVVGSQCTSEDGSIRRRGATALMETIDVFIRVASGHYAQGTFKAYVTARSLHQPKSHASSV
jgi:hypothetical protein